MQSSQASTMGSQEKSAPRKFYPGSGGRLAWEEAKWAFIFISPWVLGFIIFQAGPILASLYFSFTEYNILTPPAWSGLANFQYMFTGDPRFWKSLQVTFYYVILRVPLTVAGSLICAIILNYQIRGRVLYRTIFFIPSITPAVAATFVWMWVLDPHYGLLNYWLQLIGIQGPSWLGDPSWAVPSLVILGLWGSIGGTNALIFLSALQDIPTSYYEAAKVDGATWLQLQRHITIPLLTPAIFFVIILTIISTFQAFTAAYVATQGGPAYATNFYVLHLYQAAFKNFQMGC